MPYLDISPMLVVMRERPEEFTWSRGGLEHAPSRHRFTVDADGHAVVDADCGCTALLILPEQSRAFRVAVQRWREEYWFPRQVNRRFAQHFRPPGLWRRWLRWISAVWARWRAHWPEDGDHDTWPPDDGPDIARRPLPPRAPAENRRVLEDAQI